MAFEKIKAPSMTDLFVKSIEEKVLTGELKPGDRIPTERALSESMGVSLAVVHNGLKRLEALGFVRIVPRQGTFISDYIRCGGIDTLTELIEYAGTGYDMPIIQQFGELRRVIELFIYNEACINRTDEDLVRMKNILDRYFASSNTRERAELCFDFVHEVAISCGNIVSPLLIMTFRDLYINFFMGYSRFEDTEAIGVPLNNLYSMIESRSREEINTEVNRNIDLWLDSYSKHCS